MTQEYKCINNVLYEIYYKDYYITLNSSYFINTKNVMVFFLFRITTALILIRRFEFIRKVLKISYSEENAVQLPSNCCHIMRY